MKLSFCSKIYWHSIIVLTKASLVRMNKHSILGSVWALLQPFVHMCVISYIFSVLLKQPAELMIKNLAASLPLWSFFNLSCNNGGMALMLRENIIKKSSLSTLMYVIADLSVGLILLCHGMIAMCTFVAIIYPSSVSITWLLIPFIGAPFVISVLSIAIILAYAVPYIRDIPQVVMMLISTLYWTVPIVYPYSMIPQSKQWIFDINPLFLLINPVQILVVEGRVPDMICIAKALFVMCLTVSISVFAYKKLSRRVVYYL
jgi:lipopolysaccharide transport system permease protein